MKPSYEDDVSGDGFYTDLLENFKHQFEDGVEYPGAYIKQRIHELILRIR